jgi:hypothetical protein
MLIPSLKNVKHIYDPVFRQNYYYFDVKTIETYHNLTLSIFKVPHEVKKTKQDGKFEVYISEGVPICCIWVKDKLPEIIAHECFHAVHWVLKEKGIILSDDSEEAYAYLIQFLMANILGRSKIVKSKKK